VFKSEKYHWRF